MSGQHTVLPDNVHELNYLNIPSPNEFLCTTTMSYFNIYFMVHKMFISVGVPLDNSVISKDDIATILKTDNFSKSITSNGLPSAFSRFIEATKFIDEFVYNTIELQNITENNIIVGKKIWNFIENSMIAFRGRISLLNNQVNQVMCDINNQNKNETSGDKMVAINLYLDIFEQTVDAVCTNSVKYKEAFDFLKMRKIESTMTDDQVSQMI